MAQSPTALINPELLVWAREKIGYSIDEAARKLRVSKERLSTWESGAARPTVNQARKAAGIYRRPLAVLYLSEPPRDFDVMKDFRRLPDVLPRPFSPALRVEMRNAQSRRETALELAQSENETKFGLVGSVDLTTPPEVAAGSLRGSLGVALDMQQDWRTKYEALGAWRAAIEKHNVLVFQTLNYNRIETAEMRGFSIGGSHLPVIVLNTKDDAHGRIFTLMHEFTHIVLGHGGVCDLSPIDRGVTDEQRVEVFCNYVAAALLVPEQALLDHVVVRQHGAHRWADEELEVLSSAFRVSNEVILRRLLTLGRLDPSEYEEWRRKRAVEYDQSAPIPEQPHPIPPSWRVLASNGAAFTQMVLEAYYRDAITARDVSAFLGTKLRHIADIEIRLFGYSGGLGRAA